MSSEREILTKLNDILSSIANTLFAIGSTRMLILDRASLVYFRENGEERFRVGMSCGEKDFSIQYSPNGSPLTYDDRVRIDSETGKVAVKGLSLDGASFANPRLTGQTRFADGSAAAPAIAFSDNMDTGMFAPAANSLGLSCAGEMAAQESPGGCACQGVSRPRLTTSAWKRSPRREAIRDGLSRHAFL